MSRPDEKDLVRKKAVRNPVRREMPVSKQEVSTPVSTGTTVTERHDFKRDKALRAAKVLADQRRQLERVRALARRLLREIGEG